MINTACYAFVSTAFPDNVESLISILESIVGIGCTMGPVLGSITYSALGFKDTFFIFGGALAPAALMILIFLPSPSQVKEKNEMRDRGVSLNHDNNVIESRVASKVFTEE